jgi:hypothetical protein
MKIIEAFTHITLSLAAITLVVLVALSSRDSHLAKSTAASTLRLQSIQGCGVLG